MNNQSSKNKKPNFVLNDIIKRKILDMYKISKPQGSENVDETKKSTSSNNKYIK